MAHEVVDGAVDEAADHEIVEAGRDDGDLQSLGIELPFDGLHGVHKFLTQLWAEALFSQL